MTKMKAKLENDNYKDWGPFLQKPSSSHSFILENNIWRKGGGEAVVDGKLVLTILRTVVGKGEGGNTLIWNNSLE